jgi:hypothetical protein
MLAEVVAAVIGGDTDRDSHAVEMVNPAGVLIATLSVDNTDAGYPEALASDRRACARSAGGARIGGDPRLRRRVGPGGRGRGVSGGRGAAAAAC